MGGEAIDERAFARPGRARHANHKGASRKGKNPLQQIFRLRVVVFDRRDGARNGADVSRANLLGPFFDGWSIVGVTKSTANTQPNMDLLPSNPHFEGTATQRTFGQAPA